VHGGSKEGSWEWDMRGWEPDKLDEQLRNQTFFFSNRA